MHPLAVVEALPLSFGCMQTRPLLTPALPNLMVYLHAYGRTVTAMLRGRWRAEAPRRLGGFFRNDADHRDFTAIGTAAGTGPCFLPASSRAKSEVPSQRSVPACMAWMSLPEEAHGAHGRAQRLYMTLPSVQ